jgi:hypothetical protein
MSGALRGAVVTTAHVAASPMTVVVRSGRLCPDSISSS